jgi:hypothetical protein
MSRAATFAFPLAIQVIDSGNSANVEVLPAAMRRYGLEVVRAKITLESMSVL